MKRLALISLIVCLSGCVGSSHQGPLAARAEVTDFTNTLTAYVARTRNWAPEDYKVSCAIKDDQMLCYMVLNLTAAKAMPAGAVGGDSKSFYACINPANDRVEKEWPVE
jgi:esterase/lipase superfamily enzyme